MDNEATVTETGNIVLRGLLFSYMIGSDTWSSGTVSGINPLYSEYEKYPDIQDDPCEKMTILLNNFSDRISIDMSAIMTKEDFTLLVTKATSNGCSGTTQLTNLPNYSKITVDPAWTPCGEKTTTVNDEIGGDNVALCCRFQSSSKK